MQIEEYRNELEAFSTDLNREHYLYYSGQKEKLELAPLYDRYTDLYRLETIADLRRRRQEAPPQFQSFQQSLDKFLTFSIEHYLEMGTKETSEQIADFESRATIDWQDRRIGFYESFVVLANEPDAAGRRQLSGRISEVIARSNDLRAQRLARQQALCAELGYTDYRQAYGALRSLDYPRLAKSMEEFLAATDRLYTTRLGQALASEIGLTPAEANRCDVGYFSRLRRFDEFFPKADLLECYKTTIAGLEIDVSRQSNIFLDLEPRQRKHPRAFCSPIRIPDEIKLVILPRGGADDYAAFFHESGHAQHFAWTSPHLTVENKVAGDRAVSETYAFLFNYLIADPAWLSEILRYQECEEFYRLQKLLKLHIVRRYTGKLRYELQLHGPSDLGVDWGAVYAQSLSEATRFQYGPAEYLYDLDDGFYSADYLRAWIFEAQLREHLRSRFGRAWFKSKKAGHFLIELWETGEQYTADQLAVQIGLGTLDTGALQAELLS